MTKEEFIERYGVPLYTVGLGGSGGAIQQYVYGQNYPGLIDAGIPQRSYPDMVTQTIHIGDCELLEYYMDVTDGANPKWDNWDNREWLIGLNGSPTFPNPYLGGTPGKRRVRERLARPDPAGAEPVLRDRGRRYRAHGPGGDGPVKWTHFDDLRNIYGVGAERLRAPDRGQRRCPVRAAGAAGGEDHPGRVPRPERQGGQLEGPADMVQEGRPSYPGSFDPWSSRNMRLSPDGGVTPAPRREGDISAMNAAYDARALLRWRHRHPADRPARLPRGRAEHAQQPPVLRLAAGGCSITTATPPTR